MWGAIWILVGAGCMEFVMLYFQMATQGDDIDAMLNEVQEAELKIPFGNLEVGAPYKVRGLVRSTTEIQKKPVPGMICKMDHQKGCTCLHIFPKVMCS